MPRKRRSSRLELTGAHNSKCALLEERDVARALPTPLRMRVGFEDSAGPARNGLSDEQEIIHASKSLPRLVAGAINRLTLALESDNRKSQGISTTVVRDGLTHRHTWETTTHEI